MKTFRPMNSAADSSLNLLMFAVVVLGWVFPAKSVFAESTPAPVQLGSWHVIGPFKDKRHGLHHVSFNHAFGVETNAVQAASKLVDHSKSWSAANFPGEDDVVRHWRKRPDWKDGYLNYLPHGSAPMRNETCYLYRTITASQPTDVELRIDALDGIRLWLDGKEMATAETPNRSGSSRFAASLRTILTLKEGENRLLVKITSMHGIHGFAFAMPPYTPTHERLPGQRIASVPPDLSPRARVDNFNFDVKPMPMFDPPHLKMAERLESDAPKTDAGIAYRQRLSALRSAVKTARDKNLTNDPTAVAKAADAIEQFFDHETERLPSIVYLRCPTFRINAIAPYTTGGAAPASICVVDPSKPNAPSRVIFHDPDMRLWWMNLSYDAKTIFFSGKKGEHWHVYEIGIDGKNLRQITSGDHDNISPVLLPGGDIMFVSTRMKTRVMCQTQPSGRLFVAKRDGSNVRLVSANTLSDHDPQVMNNGQVIFTRWDYGIDKNVFCRQNLWTMNPDGTAFKLFGSNTKEDPNAFWQPRPIPGRPEVVTVFGAHHSYHAGMIGLVWNQGTGHQRDRRGEGFRWITDELSTVGDHGIAWAFQHPYPLNEHQFLVSYGGDGEQKNRLYLLDDRGNRHMIHEAEGKLGCWNPLPIIARDVPPVIPSTLELAANEYAYRDPVEANRQPADDLQGTFLLQDVYEGLGSHVKRGEIHSLHILEQMPRSREVQGAQSLWGQWVAMSRGTMYARRLVGIVPVEKDGSAHFKVPALRDISLHAVDAEGRTIRHMGSTMHVMPGETQSCVGCHETRGMTPPVTAQAPLAMKRKPSIPTYPKWTERGVLDFNRVVQPVLNSHCVKCHSGALPDGAIDLSSDKTHYFSMAYDTLLDRGQVHYVPIAGTDHEEGTAKTRGAFVSPIRKILEGKHYDVSLSREERQRIYVWIDANVPYYGTYEMTDPKTFGGRDRWYAQDANAWFAKHYKPTFDRRCMSCHERRVMPRTYNYNPRGNGEIIVSSKLWDETALSQFQHGHGRISRIGQYGPSERINLTHPEWSSALTAPLAKESGGFGFCKTKTGEPVFSDKKDVDYQRMLTAIRLGHLRLYANPRVDMPTDYIKATRNDQFEASQILEQLDQQSKPKLSDGISVLKAPPKNATNVALAAVASSDDGIPLEPNQVITLDGANDGNPKTMWDDIDNKNEYHFKLTWKSPVELAAISMTGWKHHDFAPKDFTIVADGQKIGRIENAAYVNNRLILSLPKTKCRALELRIDGYYLGSPCIRELEVYVQ